jgi:hypothetical protein
MELEQIKTSKWAVEFKAQNPTAFKDALGYATDSKIEMTITKTDSSGFMLWAIVADTKTDFWMDALATKQEAIRLCKRMGWKVKAQK